MAERRLARYTFNVPQKDNIHFYDSVDANNYDDALELIQKKYPNSKVFILAGPEKILQFGVKDDHTGFRWTDFALHCYDTLGAGW